METRDPKNGIHITSHNMTREPSELFPGRSAKLGSENWFTFTLAIICYSNRHTTSIFGHNGYLAVHNNVGRDYFKLKRNVQLTLLFIIQFCSLRCLTMWLLDIADKGPYKIDGNLDRLNNTIKNKPSNLSRTGGAHPGTIWKCQSPQGLYF